MTFTSFKRFLSPFQQSERLHPEQFVEDIFAEQSIDEAIRLRSAPGVLSETTAETYPDPTNAFAGSSDCSKKRLGEFVAEESGFVESELILESLQTDMQSYCQLLETINASLSDETKSSELAEMPQNIQKSMANIHDLKSAFENKCKNIQVCIQFVANFEVACVSILISLQELELQVSQLGAQMHNKENDLMRTRAVLEDKILEVDSKDVEIIALQEQLDSSKMNMQQLQENLNNLKTAAPESQHDLFENSWS